MKIVIHIAPRGFVALLSTVIISTILLALMVVTATAGFYARADALGADGKRVSLGLAESCISTALLRVAQNYTYDLTTDPDWSVVSYNSSKHGVKVSVGGDECYITDVVYGAEDATHRKPVTIGAQAQFRGSFSNVTTKASVQNPSTAVVVPSPTCNLAVSTPHVPTGKPVIVAWAASSNATSFTLTPTPSPAINNPSEAQNGSRTYTAGGVGTVTYTGTAFNAVGGFGQCTATVTVVPPPPSPACADSVVMLDRSGSMFTNSAWIPDEKTAANAYLNKFLDPALALSPLPLVGVGRFGDPGGSGADLIGQLTNAASYNSLFTAIANGLTNNHSSTNLAAAIQVADAELNNSTRHIDGHKKALILISDGEPNKPTAATAAQAATDAANAAKSATGPGKYGDNIPTQIFTIHFGDVAGQNFLAGLATNSANDHVLIDSATLVPSANAQDGVGNAWSTPTGAYADGGTAATDSGTHSHRFYNFGFGTLPGALSGIEVSTDAWVGGGGTTAPVTPNGIGAYDQWTQSSGTKTSAVATNDGNTSYISEGTNGQAQTFTFAPVALPPGAVITSVALNADASYSSGSGSGAAASIKFRLEKGSGAGQQDDSASQLLTTNYATYTKVYATNPFTGLAWTAAEALSWPAKFGVVRSNSSTRTPRITALNLTVTYTIPTNPACELGVDLSPDAGATWGTLQKKTLSGSEQTYVYGSKSDLWGSSWTPTSLNNTNFRVRVHTIDPDAGNTNCTNGATMNLDYLQVTAYYGSAIADADAENADGDHFFIAPNSTDMAGVFQTIGGLVCPAAAPACSNTLDDDGDGMTDAADAACHTDHDASNSTSYNPLLNDEWAAPSPPTPTVPPPPSSVQLGSWQEDPVLVDF